MAHRVQRFSLALFALLITTFVLWTMPSQAVTGVTVLNVNPLSQYRGYQTLVTVQGSGFTNATQVLVNGNVVPYFKVVNDSSLQFQVPTTLTPAQLAGKITVVSPAGTGTGSQDFAVKATPSIVNAFITRTAGGYFFIINGYALGTATGVTLAGSPASFTAVSDWCLKIPIADFANLGGSTAIVVTNPAGTASTTVAKTTVGLVNGIPAGTVGQFDVVGVQNDGSPALASGTYLGSDKWVRVAANFLTSYFRYVDLGSGNVIALSSPSLSTFTQAPTLTAANEITSAGTFKGSGGNTISWTTVSTMDSSGYAMTTTFVAGTGTLGTIRFRPYIDEDVETPGDDILALKGTVAAGNLVCQMIDQARRFGFGIDGTYSATPNKLVNATFDGFGAALYNTLATQIVNRTQVYGNTPDAGSGASYNVNTTSLTVVNNDPDFGTVYKGDVSSSLSWTVDEHATTATVTTRLVNVASNPVTPTITSFTPTTAGTGASVIITGTGLTGAMSVTFGGTNATSFTVDSDTQVTAVVGSGATGVIAVTTSGGTATSGATFTFSGPSPPSNPPSITRITPTSGGNGTTLVIQGAGLTGATAVTIGGTPARSFVVQSDTQIQAVVGLGATGTVTVTTPLGTATSSETFTYLSTAVIVPEVTDTQILDPGQSATVGTCTISNTSGVEETISSVTVSFTNPSLFSTATLTATYDQTSATSTAVPTASTLFVLSQPLVVPAGKSVTLSLQVTRAAGVAAMDVTTLHTKVAGVALASPLAGLLMILSLAFLRRRHLRSLPHLATSAATVALVCVLFTGCGGGSSVQPQYSLPGTTATSTASESIMQVTAIEARDIAGSNVSFTGLPANLAVVKTK